MRILASLLLAFLIFVLSACSSNSRTIDMKGIMEKSKQDKTKSQKADEARKSIFPNIK